MLRGYWHWESKVLIGLRDVWVLFDIAHTQRWRNVFEIKESWKVIIIAFHFYD